MPALPSRLNACAPYFLSILRIVAALLFIAHGTSKLFGWPMAGMEPPVLSLFGFAGVLETSGGILLLLGLFTRPVAFVLSGEMAFAYFLGHLPKSFFPIMNQGEAAVMFCFTFLYLVFAGPGPWSVDARLGQPRRTDSRDSFVGGLPGQSGA
jgi:putative oxidoreductase